jgi:hypothetical protein
VGGAGVTEAEYERAPGAALQPLACGYRARDPKGSVLHAAVSESLASFLREAAGGRGLPRFVQQDFERYVCCGLLSEGFTRLKCEGCQQELLVGFSCKSRGVCPSCCGRRAHDTASHLVGHVLPEVGYRQWTVSFPRRLRWHLDKDSELVSAVLDVFLRALFTHLRKRGRELGVDRGEPGAVVFIQHFTSALRLSTHFHVLVAEGLFVASAGEAGADFFSLPPPDDDEVERLLRQLVLRTVRLFERRGLLEAEPDLEDSQGILLSESLSFLGGPGVPVRKKRRCAFLEGFSLHADTQVRARDREGLERLARYAARGAIAEERLSRRDDGKLAYHFRKVAPDGSTELVLHPLELLKRVSVLVPPPRSHLTRFRGVLTP